MNQFGAMLRQERKERRMTLGDLAKRLGISVPYLSQIETGTKPLQDGFVDKVIAKLELVGDDVNRLHRAAAASMSEYRIKLKQGASNDERELAAVLANSFSRLSPQKREQIRKMIQEDVRG